MSKKAGLTIAYLILTFLLIFFGLAYGTSQLLAYFKTGAQDSGITVIDTEAVYLYYQPKINWQPLENEGREMETTTLQKISKDYLASFFHLQQAFRTGDTDGLHDYYTENPREHIIQLVENDSLNTYRGTTITHEARLDFYSADGTICSLTDRVVSFKQIPVGDGFYATYDTAEYQVMLLLEDNFWRIRHKVQGDYLELDENLPTMKTPKAAFNFEDGQSIIRGINYYPQHTPWQKMWEEFDSTTLQMDMQKIKRMSFNTIRVFVPFHAFGGASPKPSEVEKLITMLDIADQEGLKVIVTLFDFFLGYQIEEWTLSDRHAEGIVYSIKNHPALLAWDVKNEPDLDYENIGKREVNNWLSFIIKRIRTYDSSTPITIGWSQPEAMVELKEEVDFLSFHYYRDPKELPSILSSIQTTKPIFLGETGMHSFDSWWYPFKNSEKDQLTFYQEIGEVIEQKNLHYAFWTLYDFKSIPSNVAGKWAWQKGPQKSYGIVDSKDNQKPTFNWIQDFNKTPIKERK